MLKSLLNRLPLPGCAFVWQDYVRQSAALRCQNPHLPSHLPEKPAGFKCFEKTGSTCLYIKHFCMAFVANRLIGDLYMTIWYDMPISMLQAQLPWLSALPIITTLKTLQLPCDVQHINLRFEIVQLMQFFALHPGKRADHGWRWLVGVAFYGSDGTVKKKVQCIYIYVHSLHHWEGRPK